MKRRDMAAAALAALITVASPLPASAVRSWMQDADMRAELSGVKLAGVYPSGVEWTEVISADGTSDYLERGDRRFGRWTMGGELFCFEYALPMQGGCFRVVKWGPNCYELYTATVGGEMPAVPPSAESMSWNGRMWRENERSSCEDKNVS